MPSQKNPFFTNIIYKDHNTDAEYIQGFDPGTEWHEYEIVWKPTYVAWSVDGVEVRRRTNTESVKDLNKSSLLYMSFWSPEWDDWGSGFNAKTMPWFARYEYIEAYDWDKATDTFSLRFRDDFDWLNHNIWRVSDKHYFNENSSYFVEEHTYVEDGKLVFKMDNHKNDMMPNP